MILVKLDTIVGAVLTRWNPGRDVLGSPPDHATILLGSNLGQVVYSHCVPSLVSSKKETGLQKRVLGLDRFND